MLDTKKEFCLSILITIYVVYEWFFFVNYWYVESGISMRMMYKNAYDIRNDHECKALSHVFDQGQCPACFAFSLASVLGTKICLAYSKDQMIPSPYRIFDCAGKACHNAETGLNAMNVMNVMKNGVPDISKTPSVFGWGCQVGGIKSKHFREVCGIARIKEEILIHCPVIIVVDLDKKNNIPLREFKEWDDLDLRQAESNSNKHSVMGIGWADTHWIIQNSWGKHWGANGTGRVPWSMSTCVLSFDVLIEALDTKHDQ